jgi:hypothetical protein
MAIAKGHLNFTGRIGDVIYYYVGNEIYVRTVFAGQRNRVMKDDRYSLFRLYGSFFSQSSKIGSFIYRALGLKNEKKIYNKMVGEAQKFFRHTNMTGEQVLEVMVEKYMNGFEVEVPGENEVPGKTYGLLLAKRENEVKKAKERNEDLGSEIIKVAMVVESTEMSNEKRCFVTEYGEIFMVTVCGESITDPEETDSVARIRHSVPDIYA